jgi:hypothetical protein
VREIIVDELRPEVLLAIKQVEDARGNPAPSSDSDDEESDEESDDGDEGSMDG